MDRTKVMSYTHDSYSEYDLKGELVDIPQEASKESIAFAWSLNHENCFQCAFQIFDEKTNKRRCMYKKDFKLKIPLEDYQKSSHVKKFTFERHEYYYVPDEFRKIFRDMVKFLGHIHERGYCTYGIKKETFYICDGTLKFQTWYRESSASLIKEDYANVARVIRSLLTKRLKRMLRIKGEAKGDELNKLPDMEGFLGLLLKEPIIRDKKAIVDHVAVITLKRVTRFVREAFETRFVLAHRRCFQDALERTVSKENWRTVFQKNSILKQITDGTTAINDYGSENADRNLQILRVLRNLVTHGEEKESICKKDDDNKDDDLVDDNQIGIVICNFFGDILASLQEALANTTVDQRGTTYLSLLKYD